MSNCNEFELQFIELLESGHMESDICEIMELSAFDYEVMFNILYCTKDGELKKNLK